MQRIKLFSFISLSSTTREINQEVSGAVRRFSRTIKALNWEGDGDGKEKEEEELQEREAKIVQLSQLRLLSGHDNSSD